MASSVRFRSIWTSSVSIVEVEPLSGSVPRIHGGLVFGATLVSRVVMVAGVHRAPCMVAFLVSKIDGVVGCCGHFVAGRPAFPLNAHPTYRHTSARMISQSRLILRGYTGRLHTALHDVFTWAKDPTRQRPDENCVMLCNAYASGLPEPKVQRTTKVPKVPLPPARPSRDPCIRPPVLVGMHLGSSSSSTGIDPALDRSKARALGARSKAKPWP